MASSRGANLRVRISADLADIKQGLGLLRGELAKVKEAASRAAPQTASWTKGIDSVRQALGNLAGAYIGVQTITTAIRGVFTALGQMDRMDKFVQMSGVSAENISKLAYAAKSSSVDVETLAKGIGRLNKDIISGDSIIHKLGISLKDAAGNTRDVSHVFGDLADVFAQLPDGAEKAALAAKLFGNRMGPGLIPVLNLGKEGLKEFGDQAEATGNVMSTHAAQAASHFSDQLGLLKSQATGMFNIAAQQLLPVLTTIVKTLNDSGEAAHSAATGGRALAAAFKVVVAAGIIVKNVIEGIVNVLAFLGTTAFNVGKFITQSLVGSFRLLGDAVKGLVSGRNPLDVFNAYLSGAAQRARQSQADLADMKNGIVGGFAAAKQGVFESARDILNGVSALFSSIDNETKGVEQSANRASTATQGLLDKVRRLLAGEGGNTAHKNDTRDQLAAIAAAASLVQDEVKRAITALDQQFSDIKDADKSAAAITAYYEKRITLQQRLIDLQIQQARAELALATESGKRLQIEAKIAILERDRAQVAIDMGRQRFKAQEALNQKIADSFGHRLSGITSHLAAHESSISAQVNAGMLGMAEGERQLNTLRTQALETLRALRTDQQRYLDSMKADGKDVTDAVQGLAQIDQAIAEVTARQQVWRSHLEDIGSGALGGFFNDLIEGAKSFKDAFTDMVRSFLQGVAQMMARQLALKAISNIMASLGGGSRIGALLGTKVALAHGGGRAGALGLHRNTINPLLFGTAPRYHSGGVAGLHHDEIPAILKRGEIVRTKQQEAALQTRLNAGQSAPGPIHNIIVFGEDELANAMAGAAGEKVIVSHVRRNRGAIHG
ncbi:hypothetical protein [Xylella fastidiosa]|uniref:hypothetical protein n=1 Tax=Xylella fastidiosa TaxID=2371 RepID=UPI000765DEEA|nr:hypothetical protein [Xylella fastidiosa]ALR01246.1 hypothetical protein OY18_02170 [Xylella fastidiosa]ALR02377.1 hypothetical protein OY18_09305 [Xylella fastidiosa]ALR02547.1 hypothetical protein OY18_10460 [Xylella fastidiosa]KXB10896.1 hypothetical protein ADT29_12650 [Xylella fastidiosa]KXB20563.1 hypothetical protein ADT28_07415 [Xylella fastidiosa]